MGLRDPGIQVVLERAGRSGCFWGRQRAVGTGEPELTSAELPGEQGHSRYQVKVRPALC